MPCPLFADFQPPFAGKGAPDGCRFRQTAVDGTEGSVTRLAFALIGVAGVAVMVVAAAIIWLCVTEPAAIVDAIGSGHATSVLKAAAVLVVSAIGQMVRHL